MLKDGESHLFFSFFVHLNSLTSRIKLTKKQLTKEGRDGKIYNRAAKKARNEKKQFIEKWIEEEEKDQKEEERN